MAADFAGFGEPLVVVLGDNVFEVLPAGGDPRLGRGRRRGAHLRQGRARSGPENFGVVVYGGDRPVTDIVEGGDGRHAL